MRRRQRHVDHHVIVGGNFDAIDQPEIVDVHRNFGIVDLADRGNHRLVELAAGFASLHGFGLLLQEALEIVALALERLARRFGRWIRIGIHRILDPGARRLLQHLLVGGGGGDEILVVAGLVHTIFPRRKS